MSNGSSEAGSGGVQSVDRALYALEILARRGETGVTELAADIGVHKSTASRLLGALEDRELVEQAYERGKYRLGFGILRLANAVSGRLDVTQQGREICERLAADVGETVNVAVLRSHFAVNVDQARGPSAVGTQNWVGALTPLHATSSGKVLLAFMPTETRRQLLEDAGLTRFTEHTITSFEDLDEQLDSVARDGYVVALEELEHGLNAVAAPIRDHTGAVIAALSVSGPVYRLSEERAREIVPAVVEAAETIGHRMGYQG
ncbi:IclR family transcriptional regulator [Mycolicibacterium wolinskyi]|uniref:IclR family transcriptional regulator n=1 Tax=Mycolicibacterium wolinskyi TaxID=59750 RepID=A0A1X2F895_9MYCO|nr:MULTISPECIES: IclR family transcriptional regulator [Mycolicibacterium]MCV7286660.1 IclR family transcriptional regulator [Mycolicibacterium wolinskyi]MCV7293640.1 IclR family transcriptional regulator [Mycolicibacterium goodii]ORX14637.1 IclR family transcriptional regulator [Mycolicibacterium wolinskyi]